MKLNNQTVLQWNKKAEETHFKHIIRMQTKLRIDNGLFLKM